MLIFPPLTAMILLLIRVTLCAQWEDLEWWVI